MFMATFAKPLLCAGRFISTEFNLKTMQVIKKVKQMKEVEVTIENYNLCDKCNEKIETEDNYDAFECEFIHKIGSSYPEGGSGEKQEMELCQKCAVELVALLRANGYRVTDSEWDW
jgi:hypothetical protein